MIRIGVIKIDFVCLFLTNIFFIDSTWTEEEIIDISQELINTKHFKYYGVLCMAMTEFSFSFITENTYDLAHEYLSSHKQTAKLYPYMLHLVYEYYVIFEKEKRKNVLLDIIQLCSNTSLHYEQLGWIYEKEDDFKNAKLCYKLAIDNITSVYAENFYQGYTFEATIIEYFTKTKRYKSDYDSLVKRYMSCPTVPNHNPSKK